MLSRIAAIEDVEGTHLSSSNSRREPNNNWGIGHENSVLKFSIRKLSLFALALLVSSQCLTYSVRRSGRANKQLQQQEPLVTHWKVRDSRQSNAKVRQSAFESSKAVAYLAPGTVLEAYAYESKKYILVMKPVTGFVLRRLLEPLQQDDDDHHQNNHDVSSYLYEGYRKKGHNWTARYLYAPKRLVVAQQLWNGLQVLHVFLAGTLYYVYIICDATASCGQRWMVGVGGAVILVLLLPFSIYVTSPGATIFAVVSLLSCLVGIRGTRSEILLGVGEKVEEDASIRSATASSEIQVERLVPDDNKDDDEALNLVPIAAENTDGKDAFNESEELLLIKSACEMKDESCNGDVPAPAWFVVKEEMLGFLCNLASSLYNYHSSRRTWPHWYQYILSIDNFFGWSGGDGKKLDVSNYFIYTLGIDNIDVPLYVPTSKGSTFGVRLFWILWSVIPTIYVSYFLCMYLLAPRSPGVKIQRALLLFSMFHFLFMTDVVSYRYGRGYLSPNAELFHWFERWAWRVAVLMPIYQNCTSGHWKHGHYRFPLFGMIFHYAAAIWGLGFFVLQVIFSDCVRFFLFLTGRKVRTLYQLLGISSLGVDTFHPFSYHGGLVIMWVMYLVLLLGGFTPFHVSLQAKTTTASSSSEDQQRRRRSNNEPNRYERFNFVETVTFYARSSLHAVSFMYQGARAGTFLPRQRFADGKGSNQEHLDDTASKSSEDGDDYDSLELGNSIISVTSSVLLATS